VLGDDLGRDLYERIQEQQMRRKVPKRVSRRKTSGFNNELIQMAE
jgi:hypothetical protein